MKVICSYSIIKILTIYVILDHSVPLWWPLLVAHCSSLLGVALADWLVFPFLIWLIQINQATVDNSGSSRWFFFRWRSEVHLLHGKCIGIGVQTHPYSCASNVVGLSVVQTHCISHFVVCSINAIARFVSTPLLLSFVTLLIYIYITFYSCSCCIMPSAFVASAAAANCIIFWCVLINFELISYFILCTCEEAYGNK